MNSTTSLSTFQQGEFIGQEDSWEAGPQRKPSIFQKLSVKRRSSSTGNLVAYQVPVGSSGATVTAIGTKEEARAAAAKLVTVKKSLTFNNNETQPIKVRASSFGGARRLSGTFAKVKRSSFNLFNRSSKRSERENSTGNKSTTQGMVSSWLNATSYEPSRYSSYDDLMFRNERHSASYQTMYLYWGGYHGGHCF